MGHGTIAGNCYDWAFEHMSYGGGGGGVESVPELPSAELASLSDEALLAYINESDAAFLNPSRGAAQVLHEEGFVMLHHSLQPERVARLTATLRAQNERKLLE